MILFKNSKIMPSEIALRLLMAENGKPIESKDEHHGALYFRIKSLVENAIGIEHENVGALIEEFLIVGDFEDTMSGYTHAIMESDQFHQLWSDASIAWREIAPEDFNEENLENTIMGASTGFHQAQEWYEDTNTLRKFLEQLAMYVE